jgi:hypothetical protein
MSKIYHATPTAHLVDVIEIRKDRTSDNCYDIFIDGERFAGIYGRDGKPPKLKLTLDEEAS